MSDDPWDDEPDETSHMDFDVYMVVAYATLVVGSIMLFITDVVLGTQTMGYAIGSFAAAVLVCILAAVTNMYGGTSN